MRLTTQDRLALIPRVLALPDLPDNDRSFLRRVYKQGGVTGYPKDRGRLSRLISNFALSQPVHPRTEGEHAEYEETVSETDSSPELPAVPEEPSAAPIHVSAPLTSHRESDGAYPVVVQLSDKVRVIDCKDGIQWILQRRSGDQWKGVAFCRTRDVLAREAKRLFGHIPEALFNLPEHHDGLSDIGPRCGVCGRLRGKQTMGLPRHLFCIADRRAA